MKKISLPQSDHDMAMILRDAITIGESVTILERGRPVLDLIPRRNQWAQFDQTTAEDRAAAGKAFDEIRSHIRGKVTLREIISSKHEGHRR